MSTPPAPLLLPPLGKSSAHQCRNEAYTWVGMASHQNVLRVDSHFAVPCRDPNLHFVEQVALKPPEVVIDTVQQAQYEQQLKDAANAPLPDEDDDIAE